MESKFPISLTKKFLKKAIFPVNLNIFIGTVRTLRCQKGKVIHQDDGFSRRTKDSVAVWVDTTEHTGKTQGASLNLALDEN